MACLHLVDQRNPAEAEQEVAMDLDSTAYLVPASVAPAVSCHCHFHRPQVLFSSVRLLVDSADLYSARLPVDSVELAPVLTSGGGHWQLEKETASSSS